MRIITNSEKETFKFAEKFAKTLKGGEIIGLIGDLGAGKTVFAKGLAVGLGIKDTITSPTFVLMKIYQIRDPRSAIRNLVHIDAYRAKNPQDIIAIGAEEYFQRSDTVATIEWADKIKIILPSKTKFIKIKLSGNNNRIINY